MNLITSVSREFLNSNEINHMVMFIYKFEC